MIIGEIYKNILVNFKRIYVDLFLFAFVFMLFMFHAYELIPNPIQLLFYKVLIISFAIIHAHITRKLLLPSVNWNEESFSPKTLLVILIYVAFIYAYTNAG